METLIFILSSENLKTITRDDRGWVNIKFKGEDSWDLASDQDFSKGIDYIKNRLQLEDFPFLKKEILIIYSTAALPEISKLVSAIKTMKELEIISIKKAIGLFAEYSGLLNDKKEVKLKFNEEVFSVNIDNTGIVSTNTSTEKEDQTINISEIGLIAEPRKINQHTVKEEERTSSKAGNELRFDLVKMLDLKV